jgi:Skp family chaperone for outer membrane proteins
MPDEPTLGEVVRRLEAVHQDLKEDFRDVAGRLDGKVSIERFQYEKDAQLERDRLRDERLKAIEDAREREAREKQEAEQKAATQRASDRRLIFSALIAPVLMVLLTLYLNSQGAGS